MSKYNLSDILNEYIGGGRIGTLKISFRDLQDKMDELENSGKVIVRTLPGPSGDGKVNREFEVVDRDSAVPGGGKQERGFTVYDYKFGFDPGSEEHFMEEYPFSVGGNDLKLAMELIDGVESYGINEENVIKDLAQADEVIKMIKMMNPDVRADLLKRIARMGQKNEQMYIDDDEFEMEMGRSKKDSLKKEMMIHVDQLIDGNIDMNDFMNVVEDIMAEVNSLKESTGPSDKAETEDDVVNVDKVAGPGAKGRNYGAETSANTAEDDMEDKEVANPRPMYEAPGSTINITQDDMDKLHNDGKADIDGHKVVYKMNENGEVDNFANELSEESSKKVKIRAYLKDYYTNPNDPKDVRIDDELIDEFFEYSKDVPNFENMDMDEIVDEYDEFIFQNKDVMEDLRKQFKRFM